MLFDGERFPNHTTAKPAESLSSQSNISLLILVTHLGDIILDG